MSRREHQGDGASVRNCVGCRQRDDRCNLVRFVVREGRLWVDASQRLPGRGAWVHARPGCLERGLKRGGFARALRAPVRDEVERVVRSAVDACGDETLQLLGLLRRSGGLHFGRDEALRQAQARGACALWLAGDAAERTTRDVRRAAEEMGIPVHSVADRARMGAALGTAPVAVVAFPAGRAGRRAAQAMARWAALAEEAEVYNPVSGA